MTQLKISLSLIHICKLHWMINLLGHGMEVMKPLGLPSLLTRTHTDLLFYHWVLLRLNGLSMTTGLKVPIYTLCVSSKFIGAWTGSCSPVVRCIELADLYVDVLDFSIDKKKSQWEVRYGIFRLTYHIHFVPWLVRSITIFCFQFFFLSQTSSS